jgi:hypothetical protein
MARKLRTKKGNAVYGEVRYFRVLNCASENGLLVASHEESKGVDGLLSV